MQDETYDVAFSKAGPIAVVMPASTSVSPPLPSSPTGCGRVELSVEGAVGQNEVLAGDEGEVDNEADIEGAEAKIDGDAGDCLSRTRSGGAAHIANPGITHTERDR